jgi:isoquinoline 1-oxidoreductase
MMDELAHAAGKDPLEFRLAHLENPRLRAVLEEVAKRAQWGHLQLQQNTGVGLACATEKGSFVASFAQVQVDPSNKTIKVFKIIQAFECGAILNPDNLRSQNIGAIIMGLGPALREQMEFEKGKIQNASLWKYQVPRFTDVPQIEVHLLDRKDLPSSGAGETPLITVAPAIANAVFNATGQRLRDLPLTLT